MRIYVIKLLKFDGREGIVFKKFYINSIFFYLDIGDMYIKLI